MVNHPQHRPGVGRDELNLIDFPLGVLTATQPLDASGKRVDELVSEVQVFDNDLGAVVPKRLTRRTASKEGFPTPKETDLLIGLFRLTELANGFQHPKVEFRPGELYRLMNWSTGGSSRLQLLRGLDRLNGLNLKFENAWRETSGSAWVKEFHTGILDGYQVTTRTDGTNGKEPCWIQWSAELFSDVKSGNVRVLNAEEFFSLKRPISRQMYRFLDKHLTDSPAFEMELKTFATHIGLAEQAHIGKIKERLAPAITELQKLSSFIAVTEERYQKIGTGHWIIRFERAVAATEVVPPPGQRFRRTAKLRTSDVDNPAVRLVTEFHRQWNGIDDYQGSISEIEKASGVINQYGEEQAFEWLPMLVKILRKEFPAAKVFGATQLYWPKVAKKKTRPTTIEPPPVEKRVNDIERTQRKQKQLGQWSALPATEQDSIRSAVAQKADSEFLRQSLREKKYNDPLVMIACIAEMRLRNNDNKGDV